MRKKMVNSWLLNRGIFSLLVTLLLHTIVLDKSSKVASDILERAHGPGAAVVFLLVLGLFVHLLVYRVIAPPLFQWLIVGGRHGEKYFKSKVRP